MKKVLFFAVLSIGIISYGYTQNNLSGTYRYSTNAFITFTGNNFSGSWNKDTAISGSYSISGNRLTLNITSGPKARATWTWTIVDINFLRDQDGDRWNKEEGSSINNIIFDGTTFIQDLVMVFKSVENNKEYVIELSGNERIDAQTLSFPSVNNITIRLISPERESILSLSGNGSIFTIEKGVTLILDKGVTLLGHKDNNISLVKINSNGKLIMENDSKILGNNSGNNGGGVYINGGGQFLMQGGEISNNKVGLYGGGVYSKGFFNMSNGKISGNIVDRNDGFGGGGGVYTDAGTFNMSGGEISGNRSQNGGGISLSGDYVVFKLSGGLISGNNASLGGGIYSDATFSMSGGEISGNTADNGGGIRMTKSFTMSNGTISNNTAIYSGGGVHVSGIFTLEDGVIFGNKAKSGGGIFIGVYSDTLFRMKSGKIFDNTATTNGGGVSVEGNSSPFISSRIVFAMEHGIITSNTSPVGAGVYMELNRSNPIFVKTSGTIFGFVQGDPNSNRATAGNNNGHAVYINPNNTSGNINRRESTADLDDKLDSRINGIAGGWGF